MFTVASIARSVIPVLALAGALSFTGCAGPSTSSSSGQDSIRTLTTAAGTRWVLASWTSADGQKHTIAPPVPTLVIGDQGRITGNAGVNHYVGNITVSKGVLDWGPHIAATRMAGSPEAMESENRYLDDLKATDRVTIRGNRLQFTGEKPLRLEFTRANR